MPNDRAARELLISHLTRTQRISFRQCGTFVVKGSDGGSYTLAHGEVLGHCVRGIRDPRSHVLPQEEARRSLMAEDYCATLAMKLLIEANEPQFRQVADHPLTTKEV